MTKIKCFCSSFSDRKSTKKKAINRPESIKTIRIALCPIISRIETPLVGLRA